MANVTLADLILKIRRLTARPSVNQITDTQIVNYINLYYELDFPQELKVFDFKTNYTFFTQPNIDTYVLSQTDRNNYNWFAGPAYCAGFEMQWFQDQETFYRYYPKLKTVANVSVGTGIAGPYTFTMTGVPILRGSLVLTGLTGAGTNTIATDNFNGGFIDNTGAALVGSVNYTTGVVTITFGAIVSVGATIEAQWTPYTASRPYSLLFYNNTFTFRPVPDDTYEFKCAAFIKPSAYDEAIPGERPFLDEYFDMLAYGASQKIFVDSLEMESHAALEPLFRHALMKVERKTIMEIKNQRTRTIYMEDQSIPTYRYPII